MSDDELAAARFALRGAAYMVVLHWLRRAIDEIDRLRAENAARFAITADDLEAVVEAHRAEGGGE